MCNQKLSGYLYLFGTLAVIFILASILWNVAEAVKLFAFVGTILGLTFTFAKGLDCLLNR